MSMTPDWPLWAWAGGLTGIAYGLAVAYVNTHTFYGRRRGLALTAEALIALALIAGEVCGLTGLWWLMRPLALAYVSVGGPVIVALFFTAVTVGASGEEYAQIQHIRDTSRPVRVARVRSGNGQVDPRAN